MDSFGRLQGETLRAAIYATDRGNPLVDLGAYCLMPNHFHLLLAEHAEGGISRFMQKVTTAYTMYFNKRHKHSGVLLQGVFKSSHAHEDRYLKYLVSYMHLNPMKLIDSHWKENGIRDRKAADDFLSGYRYSSYTDYLGKQRIESALLNKKTLLDLYDIPADINASIAEWLSCGDGDEDRLIQ